MFDLKAMHKTRVDFHQRNIALNQLIEASTTRLTLDVTLCDSSWYVTARRAVQLNLAELSSLHGRFTNGKLALEAGAATACRDLPAGTKRYTGRWGFTLRMNGIARGYNELEETTNGHSGLVLSLLPSPCVPFHEMAKGDIRCLL
jgi:hypothetical protein